MGDVSWRPEHQMPFTWATDYTITLKKLEQVSWLLYPFHGPFLHPLANHSATDTTLFCALFPTDHINQVSLCRLRPSCVRKTGSQNSRTEVRTKCLFPLPSSLFTFPLSLDHFSKLAPTIFLDGNYLEKKCVLMLSNTGQLKTYFPH